MIRRNEAERMLVTVRTFAYVAIDEDRRPRKVPGSANGLRVKLIGVGNGSRATLGLPGWPRQENQLCKTAMLHCSI